MIIGEAWGAEEARLGQAFVGSSGGVLIKMLSEAGIITLDATDKFHISQYYRTRNPKYNAKIWERHNDIHCTNVFNLHPDGNDLGTLCGPKFLALDDYPALVKSKYISRQYAPELDRLAGELLNLNPNLVICLGNTPLWALSGRTGIKKFRGTTFLSSHCAADFKCLATYHPAYILRQWKDRSIVIADLIKAHRESTTPTITRPEREIWIEPTLADIRRFIVEIINPRRNLPLSVDIETSGSRVTCIGLGYSDIAIVIPFDDARTKDRSYWPTCEAERDCWVLVRGVLEDRSFPKLFQNGLYDIAFLYRSMGIRVMGAAEDTMLAHHALQPEMIKDLGFLGSVYTDEGAWKHMGKRQKTIKGDN
jgi:DNA polymerase